MSRNPTVVVVADAHCPTGFSRVAHSIIAELVPSFKVHHVGLNHRGPTARTPWRIYRGTRPADPFGLTTLTKVLRRTRPDIVLVINDIWVAAQYVRAIQRSPHPSKVVLYTPIESDPIEPESIERLAAIAHTWVTYTEFGARELQAALDALESADRLRRPPRLSTIPHGVDSRSFHPVGAFDERGRRDRSEARRRFFGGANVPADSFIVLNANRNQPRKRIDTTIEGFALFARDKPSTVSLYLHMAREDAGWDVLLLARRFGVLDRLVVFPRNRLPNLPIEQLNLLYNACDVGINTSVAEGWGLVAFEHAATGAAQIVPDHTTQSELWRGHGIALPPAYVTTSEQLLTNAYHVSPESLAAALDELYADRTRLQAISRSSYDNAVRPAYRWTTIGAQWRDLLASALEG